MDRFDVTDGDILHNMGGGMLMDTDGNLMQDMGSGMAMDMESGDIHITSGGFDSMLDEGMDDW